MNHTPLLCRLGWHDDKERVMCEVQEKGYFKWVKIPCRRCGAPCDSGDCAERVSKFWRAYEALRLAPNRGASK